MTSQECQEEVEVIKLLGEAAGWSDQEITQQLPTILPRLNDFLKTAPPAQAGVQATRFAFGSFLPHMEVGQTAFSLFNAAFPFLSTSFSGFLQDVDREKDSMDRVIELLQECNLVVECCAVGIQFLLQVERVAVEDVRCVPEAVLHILTSTLHHCSCSEERYLSQLEVVKESLSSLFIQAVELTLHLASFLPNITFDTFSQLDTETLVTVCQQLPSMAGSLSRACEVRGCVLVWRAYSSLIHRHHSALLTLLDPAPPLAALAAEIKSSLLLLPSLANAGTAALNEKDKKVMQRAGKMAAFCLKVVVGMCEKFRGYLYGAHQTLASLLRLLYRFRCSDLAVLGSGQRVEEVLEAGRQVALGIDPLLDHLREDQEFVEAVLAAGEEVSPEVGRKESDFEEKVVEGELEEKVVDSDQEEKTMEGNIEMEEGWTSHLLLLLALPLPPTPTTSLHLNTILAKVFHCLPKCHSSLSLQCQLEGVMCGGRAADKTSLYQHVLVRVCAAAATLHPAQFHTLEDTLLPALLSPHSWTSLLASDLWCFITRYGNSEVCLNHCRVLVKVLQHTTPASPQHLVTTALLARLTTKLTPQHCQQLSHTITSSTKHAAASQLILAQLESKQDTADKVIQSFMEECTRKMDLILSRSATGQVVLSLVEDLQQAAPLLSMYTRHRSMSDSALAKFSHVVLELWTRVPVAHAGSTVVDALIWSLLEATLPLLHCLSSIDLFQILNVVRGVLRAGRSSTVVGVGVCELVTALGPSSLPPNTQDLPQLLSLIASIMTEVLESANPLVHQAALDAFEAFGCHTQHEEVLVESLGSCREEIQARITAYLQRQPHTAHQPRLILLHTQEDTPNTHTLTSRASKNIKLINDTEFSQQPAQNSEHPHRTTQGMNPEVAEGSGQELIEGLGEKSAKRRREEEENSSRDDVGALLDSLKQCRALMRRLMEGCVVQRDGVRRERSMAVEGPRRKEVRSVLEEMVSLLGTEVCE